MVVEVAASAAVVVEGEFFLWLLTLIIVFGFIAFCDDLCFDFFVFLVDLV